MNIEDLDPALIGDALRNTGDEVDARSGEAVKNVKKNTVWEGQPDKFKNKRQYVMVRGHLQCCSAETGYKYRYVTDEFENGGRMLTEEK